jgi:hypothetical protein
MKKAVICVIVGILVGFTGCPSPTDTDSPDSKDASPPNEISNLSAIIGDNLIELTWLNPTDKDFNHVEITYVSNVHDDYISVEKASHSKIITELENSIEYTFTIKTVDNDENKSKGIIIKKTPDLSNISNIIIETGDGKIDLLWQNPSMELKSHFHHQ